MDLRDLGWEMDGEMDGEMEVPSLPLSEHRYTRRVQFYETDLAGMVHFSWYLRYMEEAEHALWREAGLSIVPPDRDLGFPRVSATVDFHAPLRFEDVFEVWIRVAAITKRTFKYASTITRGDTRIATGAITAVCVRKHPLQAIDIPEDLARRFAVYDGDIRIG